MAFIEVLRFMDQISKKKNKPVYMYFGDKVNSDKKDTHIAYSFSKVMKNTDLFIDSYEAVELLYDKNPVVQSLVTDYDADGIEVGGEKQDKFDGDLDDDLDDEDFDGDLDDDPDDEDFDGDLDDDPDDEDFEGDPDDEDFEGDLDDEQPASKTLNSNAKRAAKRAINR